MEAKDWVTLLGIIATLVVSLINLYIGIRNSKKTIFINSVTASRIKWIETVRNNISEFCGLAYHYAVSELGNKELQSVVERIDKLRFIIKLQLNRNDPFDKLVMEKIDTIILYTDTKKPKLLDENLDSLIELTQDLLKLEWEGVKAESKKGELTKAEKHALYKRYLKVERRS